MDYQNSRRSFLVSFCKGAAAVSVATAFGSSFLSSCKKNQPANGANAESTPAVAGNTETCPNTSTLTEQENAIRKSLNYTDTSKVPGRFCDNCKLYTLPPNKQTLCGGCKVIPGAIHPKGYCTAWIQLM